VCYKGLAREEWLHDCMGVGSDVRQRMPVNEIVQGLVKG
jgi:hypothetical protein